MSHPWTWCIVEVGGYSHLHLDENSMGQLVQELNISEAVRSKQGCVSIWLGPVRDCVAPVGKSSLLNGKS